MKLIIFFSFYLKSTDASNCVIVKPLRLFHSLEFSFFSGDVSHLCQISPQLDPRRHLLGPDRPLGQPGRAEEDAGAEVAAVVVGSHAPGLLHEGRRNSECAQLG